MANPDKECIEQFVRDVADRSVSRRDLMTRAAAIGLAAPVAGMVLQARIDGVDAQAAEPTGKLTVSMSVEPDTLENWKAYSTDGHPILRNVQEALLNRDPSTNELVGELATGWEQTDERTWRFTLRQGVTFHNGDPFNAEVAAFGIN
jgi:peptide/nickel transport system substrate-binding protein